MTKSAPGGTHAQYDVIWQEFSFVGIISRKWLGLGLGFRPRVRVQKWDLWVSITLGAHPHLLHRSATLVSDLHIRITRW